MPCVFGLRKFYGHYGTNGLPARQCCKCEPARSSASSARLEANRRAMPDRLAARSDAIARPQRGRWKCGAAHRAAQSARFEVKPRAMLERLADRTNAIARLLETRRALSVNRSFVDMPQDWVQPERRWAHTH